MAYERQWSAVPAQALTANGTSFGLVTVANTAGFRVKQSAILKGTGLPNLPVQIKIVFSPTELMVGYVDSQIANWKRIDISAYTVAAGSNISAEWQPKNTITVDDIFKAVYESDPVTALRIIGVDQYGAPWTADNPIPVTFDGTIAIGEVEIKGSPSGNLLDVNADGSIKTVGLFTLPYDTIEATYPTTTQEVYTSHLGGAAGPVQQVVTVNYTDATKNFITEVLRVPVG